MEGPEVEKREESQIDKMGDELTIPGYDYPVDESRLFKTLSIFAKDYNVVSFTSKSVTPSFNLYIIYFNSSITTPCQTLYLTLMLQCR